MEWQLWLMLLGQVQRVNLGSQAHWVDTYSTEDLKY